MIEKIKTWPELAQEIVIHKKAGKKIVFTNGCFDILHAGHVLGLQEASSLGDILIVGLNSDASVGRLKGLTRPVNLQEDRAIVLAAISCVDYISIFEQDTPYELIKLIEPDVLAKGGDWELDKIPGRDIVEKRGGNVVRLQYHTGKSTTGIIEKILRL